MIYTNNSSLSANALTLDKLREAVRKVAAVPDYELRASALMPKGAFYIVNRADVDPHRIFPAHDRTPLVICAKSEEDDVRAHLFYDPSPLRAISKPHTEGGE